MPVTVKRVYDDPAADDGCRILVERLWPRGLTRERARVDLWLRELAPSTELRRWFDHDPERWAEFRRRYAEELAERPDAAAALDELRARIDAGPVTFVYASRKTRYNAAVALREHLDRA